MAALNFAADTTGFSSCPKVLLHAVKWDRRLYFPSEGSGAPDFYHP
jgi:hypothetical protein